MKLDYWPSPVDALSFLTSGRLASAVGDGGRLRQWLAAGAGAALAAFLAVETYKSWPLSYHVRLFALLLRCRFFPRPLVALDVPIVTRGRVRLSDIDYHGHVNNAQYALDADLLARYPWISAVLMNTGVPYRANAFIGSAVFFFVREMRWRARYRIETRCVGVDEKWIYVESRWYLEDAAASTAARAARRATGASGGASGALEDTRCTPGTLGTEAAASSSGAASSGGSGGAGSDSVLTTTPAAVAANGSGGGSGVGTLAAVKLTRFVLKESYGPQRGKTITPRVVFRELGLAVPEGFERGARLGDFFSEAFQTTVSSERGRRQSLADCGC
jgi:acyl-CoA thioesterase FadM